MSNQSKGINTFQRYLSVWVLFCMIIGVTIGHFIPAIPATLGQFQISGISIPIAVLIWVMIYPMMMKVDFQSVKQIGKNPKGLLITWVTNWLIKPFTMRNRHGTNRGTPHNPHCFRTDNLSSHNLPMRSHDFPEKPLRFQLQANCSYVPYSFLSAVIRWFYLKHAVGF